MAEAWGSRAVRESELRMSARPVFKCAMCRLLLLVVSVCFRVDGLHAGGLSGKYCLQNSKSRGYLNQDISSDAKISNVQVWSDCKSPESQWELVLLDDAKGIYALRNAWSGNWLNEDVSGGARPNGPVHVWSDHRAAESQWLLAVTVATEYTLKNARTGYLLGQSNGGASSHGDDVIVTDGDGAVSRWQLTPAGSPSPSPAPAPREAVSFRVADGGSGSRAWPFLTRCVGSGHAWLALRKDWQDQLARVRRDLGTEFVRFHGLLDDDMAVYQGPGNYSFANVDTVYDFLTRIGMRPVVEVSFMPASLARGTDTGFYPAPRQCHVNPPKDYDEWGRLIQALGQHLVDRYGEAEVGKWFFEVWNEPNCGFLRTDLPKSRQCCEACADMTEYMRLYKSTAEALKRASSKIRVGGPATAQLGHVDDFVEAVQKQGLAGGEVVTTHVYPTDPMTSFLHAFEDVAASARKGQAFADTFILSEFNSGLYGNDVGNHDRAFAAAFLFSFAADVLQKRVDIPRLRDFMASYWTFSDVFEEQGFPTKDFQNGFGMITYKGIPKPAYRAMQLLTFGDEVVDVSLESPSAGRVKALALRSSAASSRKVRVFLSNLDEPRARLGAADVTLSFDSAPSAMAVYRIDDDHTNPRELWESLGRPDLQGEQLKSVMKASEASAEEVKEAKRTTVITIPARGAAVVEASWGGVAVV
uniref:Ricin B lectin domain-containing protein n=1 Tax=Alexandrium monilatum TaxID=311494 RepID=A0A7S4TB18_9DINO